NEMPAAFIQLLIHQLVGFCKIVLPRAGGVGCPLKPRSDKGRGCEILFIGNRFWDEGVQIELLATPFQLLPVLGPGPAPPPMLFAVEQGDDGSRPGEQNGHSPQVAPREEPSHKPPGPPEDARFRQNLALPNTLRLIVHVGLRISDFVRISAFDLRILPHAIFTAAATSLRGCASRTPATTRAPVSSKTWRRFSRRAAKSCWGDGMFCF